MYVIRNLNTFLNVQGTGIGTNYAWVSPEDPSLKHVDEFMKAVQECSEFKLQPKDIRFIEANGDKKFEEVLSLLPVTDENRLAITYKAKIYHDQARLTIEASKLPTRKPKRQVTSIEISRKKPNLPEETTLEQAEDIKVPSLKEESGKVEDVEIPSLKDESSNVFLLEQRLEITLELLKIAEKNLADQAERYLKIIELERKYSKSLEEKLKHE